MDTVTLSFRYSENDYARAVRAHYASRLRLPLDIALTIGLAGLGAYAWYSQSKALGSALLVVTGVFALMLFVAFAVIPYIVFRGEPKLRDEYSLTFSPKGIHLQTAHINSEVQWSVYSHALVDAHSFILYYGSRSFTVIPKRVLQDAAQRETFERLLTENVPRIVDKTK